MVKSPRPTRQVFVAYPYNIYPDADYRRVYRSVGKDFDVRFVFADEEVSNEHIMAKILRDIRASDFSIFDISGWNANVTLELGMAYALNAPHYICYNPMHNATKDVPSNLRGFSRIQYDSLSKLEDGLVKLLDQQYPRESDSLDEHTARMRGAVARLLKEEAGNQGLSIAAISERLKCNKRMARVILEEMMSNDEVVSIGKGRGTHYVAR